MKKTTFLLFALLFTLKIYSQTFSAGDVIYTIENLTNKTVTVHGLVNSAYPNLINADLTIPATVTFNNVSFAVKSIDPSAFTGCTAITSVSLPNSITSIGAWAFYKCKNITSINIPNTVSIIGRGAFNGCSSLTSIVIPESVKNIESLAFKECSNLISVNIPNSIGAIEDYTFYYCSRLSSIIIPESVKRIGLGAFSGCSSLTTLVIPKSINTIEKETFSSCYSLTTLTIPNSVISIKEYAFRNCSSLLLVDIPNSVISVGESSFLECKELTTVNISTSVSLISTSAFNSCPKLTTFNVNSSNLNFSSIDGVLFNKNITTLIKYPEGKLSSNYSIPESVSTIGDVAFSGCLNLESAIIPSSVTSIGDGAFHSCTKLASITFPGSVRNIGSLSFYGCSGLSSIYVKNPSPANIAIGTSIFNLVNKSTCKLFIPIGSMLFYMNAVTWKDFNNIQEYDFLSSINLLTPSDAFITLKNNILSISSISIGEKVCVMTINGITLFNTIARKEKIDIQIPNSGFLIIRIGNKQTKFFVD